MYSCKCYSFSFEKNSLKEIFIGKCWKYNLRRMNINLYWRAPFTNHGCHDFRDLLQIFNTAIHRLV